MPPNLTHSGYCCVLYDVDKTGKPKNIRTPYCTDKIFSKPSISAFSKWRYPIALKNGKAITVKNLTNIMSYRITDDAGNYIPSPQGFLERLKPNEKIPPQPKNYPEADYWAEEHFNLEKPCGEPIV